jgi:beta-glucosidase
MAKFAYRRYHLPIIFTENGFSNIDFVMMDGKVHDPQRINYIHTYLLEIRRAMEDGIPITGYLYWSIMDNFEWFEGYDMRFGLIYVDYPTQKRTLKDSAFFYRDTILSNGTNI